MIERFFGSLGEAPLVAATHEPDRIQGTIMRHGGLILGGTLHHIYLRHYINLLSVFKENGGG